MAKREEVPQEIINAAYANFIEMFHPNGTGKGLYLWNFIGGRSEPVAGRIWLFKPLQISRLHALAGPHYKAIAKILILQGCDPYKELKSE